MPTDAERFQFIAKFRPHVSFHDDHVTLMWQEKVQHWEASPPYYPVASGKTLEDATDAAIAFSILRAPVLTTHTEVTTVCEILYRSSLTPSVHHSKTLPGGPVRVAPSPTFGVTASSNQRTPIVTA